MYLYAADTPVFASAGSDVSLLHPSRQLLASSAAAAAASAAGNAAAAAAAAASGGLFLSQLDPQISKSSPYTVFYINVKFEALLFA